ncbi:MAG TPA: RHS repeat-associated core domain-containing protein [Ktedonobacterales bacterium]
MGSDPSSAPRSYHLYNAHGDVVDLSDTQGNLAATYSYDGRDGARYDTSTGLYWLSVRSYDPTLGHFLSRDPLGRAPMFFSDNLL